MRSGTSVAAGLRRRGGGMLVVPGVLAMVVFFMAPLLMFVAYSFLTPGQFDVSTPATTHSYTEAISSSLNRQLAWRSFRTGLIVSVITTVVALPVAYWLRYLATPKLRSFGLFIIAASLFASYLVRLYAWITILGTHGLLNEGLVRSGIASEPLSVLLFSPYAVAIAAIHLYLPFAILVIYAGMRPLEPDYLEAADVLGANAFARWRRVVLPLTAQPMVSAAVFVGIVASSEWALPQFLGGTSGDMLGLRIYNLFLEVGDYAAGAALSLLMLLVYGLIYLLAAFILRRARLSDLRWV